MRSSRNSAREAVADISVDIRVDVIQRGRDLIGKALEEFIPVPSPIDAVDNAELRARLMGGPFKSKDLVLKGVSHEIADDGSVAGEANEFSNHFSPADPDDLLFAYHPFPFLSLQVTVGIGGIELLPEKVRVIA